MLPCTHMKPSRLQLLIIMGIVFGAAFVGTLVAVSLQSSDGSAEGAWGGPLSSCNVLMVPVHGTIVSTRASVAAGQGPVADDGMQDGGISGDSGFTIAEDVVALLRDAAVSGDVEAVIIDVDSYGGSPAAAHEIADAIRRIDKPSVAVIHEAGLSAGYLIASAADAVYAGQESSVGSIGVTASYLTNLGRNVREGLEYQSLATGQYKDTFNPDKPLTGDERALIMRDLRISHQNFVNAVAQFRGLPTSTVERLADGSSMLGAAALKAGLVDALGFTVDAESYLSERLDDETVVCRWY
ncbi:S49 family peptidase [Candidatus Kaiserbacteria bacterium]|nr:S49 family peptidase [Candidatus Kaiserbacteria bacterium]